MSGNQPTESGDRRRDSRVRLEIPVDYSDVDDFFTQFTSNINEGGIFVEMEKPPEIDAEVQLKFRLPGTDEPLQVEGRVAWVRSATEAAGADASTGPDGPTQAGRGGRAGVGIQFQHLSTATREKINQLVRQLRNSR
jgi:uncharacterized protein (TIGR02266 family)